MEFQQIRYFVAVATFRSFTVAAKRCHVTQPALSNGIRQLEDECGHRLMERLPHKIILTRYGEALLARGTRILTEFEHIPREMRDLHTSHCGILKIGVPPTLAHLFLPLAIAPFREKYPETQIDVTYKTTVELLPFVGDGELDFAIVTLPIPDHRLATEELFTEELLLAIPAHHEFARRPAVKHADLRNEPFIGIKDGTYLGEQTRAFLGEHEIRPSVVLDTHDTGTVQAYVSKGLGLALVPASARLDDFPAITYRAIENPKPTRTLGVAWLKGHEHTRIAAEFLLQLRKVARELSNQHSVERIRLGNYVTGWHGN